jgi:hypothetical protein
MASHGRTGRDARNLGECHRCRASHRRAPSPRCEGDRARLGVLRLVRFFFVVLGGHGRDATAATLAHPHRVNVELVLPPVGELPDGGLRRSLRTAHRRSVGRHPRSPAHRAQPGQRSFPGQQRELYREASTSSGSSSSSSVSAVAVRGTPQSAHIVTQSCSSLRSSDRLGSTFHLLCGAVCRSSRRGCPGRYPQRLRQGSAHHAGPAPQMGSTGTGTRRERSGRARGSEKKWPYGLPAARSSFNPDRPWDSQCPVVRRGAPRG